MFIWWFKKRASFYCTIHIRGNPVSYISCENSENDPFPEQRWNVSCKTLDLCYRFLKLNIFFLFSYFISFCFIFVVVIDFSSFECILKMKKIYNS